MVFILVLSRVELFRVRVNFEFGKVEYERVRVFELKFRSSSSKNFRVSSRVSSKIFQVLFKYFRHKNAWNFCFNNICSLILKKEFCFAYENQAVLKKSTFYNVTFTWTMLLFTTGFTWISTRKRIEFEVSSSSIFEYFPNIFRASTSKSSKFSSTYNSSTRFEYEYIVVTTLDKTAFFATQTFSRKKQFEKPQKQLQCSGIGLINRERRRMTCQWLDFRDNRVFGYGNTANFFFFLPTSHVLTYIYNF